MNTQEFVSTQSMPEQTGDANSRSGAISKSNVIQILSKKASGEFELDLERQVTDHEKLVNDMHNSLHYHRKSIDRMLTQSPVKSIVSSPATKSDRASQEKRPY